MATYIPQYTEDGVQIRFEDEVSWLERTKNNAISRVTVKAILIKNAFFEGRRIFRITDRYPHSHDPITYPTDVTVDLDSYLLGGVSIPNDDAINLVAPEGFFEAFMDEEFGGVDFDYFIDNYTVDQALHGLAHFMRRNPVVRWENLFHALASFAPEIPEEGITVKTKTPQGDVANANISSAVDISTFTNCIRIVQAAFATKPEMANLPVRRLCSNDTLAGKERKLGFGLDVFIPNTEHYTDEVCFYVWF